MDKLRILLVGSGGVGTMAAYALETGGMAEVTAVLRSNYDIVQERGFSIDSIEHGKGITGFRPAHIRNTVPDVKKGGMFPYDYIVVSTKNIPDISPTVLDLISPAVHLGTTVILLLQNGINIEKPIVEAFPDNVVLSGVSIISASEPMAGHILHEFRDDVKIGPFPRPSASADVQGRGAEAANDFIKAYNACGKVHAHSDEDVLFTRWRKLVYNASFNPISAILGIGVITMRKTHFLITTLILPLMNEVIAIAAAAGVRLPDSVAQDMITTDPVDDDFLPSMGQDAAKGQCMEVEVIVGEAVREAARLGVKVEILPTIYALLRGMQTKTKVARGLQNLRFGEDNPYG